MNDNISWQDVIGALIDVGPDAPADVLASELLGISLDKIYQILEDASGFEDDERKENE